MKLLPHRFERAKPLLEAVRICLGTACIQRHVDELRPLVVIIDNKLYNIGHPRKFREELRKSEK